MVGIENWRFLLLLHTILEIAYWKTRLKKQVFGQKSMLNFELFYFMNVSINWMNDVKNKNEEKKTENHFVDFLAQFFCFLSLV